MPTLRKLAAMLIATAIAASTLLGAALAAPLAGERWNKRVVLVFAPGESAGVTRQFEALLADREALSERDMLLVKVVGNAVSAPFGEMPTRTEAGALREAYGISEDAPFTVILVGKDGGEKLRRAEPVAARDVFGLIDSMPMRQREAGG